MIWPIKGAAMACLALTLPVGAMAQSSESQGEKTEQAAKKESERKVCKTSKVTGSLIRSRKICMTQQEWDDLATATQKDMGEMSRRSGMASGGGSNPFNPQ